MNGVTVDNIKITTSEILASSNDTAGFSANANTALAFMRFWLKGGDYFEISTSGTTGKPKRIKISRKQMVMSAEMTARAVGINSGDTALVCLNTNYIGGIMMLVRGMTLNLNMTITEPSANPFATLKKNQSFDFIAMVPIQLETLLNQPDGIQILNRCKVILIGGASISESLLARIHDLNVSIYATYGMTETVSHVALKRINGHEAKTFFTALPEVHIGVDSRGCLTISSPLTNDKTIVTNDCVTLIDDHSFHWMGRIDNVVNSGGIKIHLEQVENEVNSLLKDLGINLPFFVAAVKDDYYGQSSVLCLEGQENNSSIILAKLKKKLGYRSPKAIKWIVGFERTPTGKIDREATFRIM